MAIKFLILCLMIFQCLCQIVNEYKWADCKYDNKICIDCECRCRKSNTHSDSESAQQLFILCKNRSISSLDGELMPAIKELKPNLTFLDLSLNKLDKIPSGIFHGLDNVKELSLHDNLLTDLNKDSFAGLTGIAAILLDRNRFKEFPTLAFIHEDLSSLREISCNFINCEQPIKDLYNIKGAIPFYKFTLAAARFKCQQHQCLRQRQDFQSFFDGCFIQTLSGEHFDRLHQLEVLWLQDNRILEIPKRALFYLHHLRFLKLSGNLISVIPPLIFYNNSRLRVLSLSDNNIHYIPDNAFAGLKSLVELHLDGNPISNIGIKAFINLPSLTNIKISHAQNLRALPTLSGTFNLEELFLESCNIAYVPKEFCEDMGNLEKLDLPDNKIEVLPSLIGCTNLRTLNLRSNRIQSIGNYSFYGPATLLDLVLKENLIESIPEMAFYGLRDLQHLDMSHNKITFIHPNAFLPLETLEILNLAHNQFQVLPSAGLSSLVDLFTAHNLELNSIPPPEELPMIRLIKTAYAYHCCQYYQYNGAMDYSESSVLKDHTWLKGPSQAQDSYSFNDSIWSGDYISNGSTYFNLFSFMTSKSILGLDYEWSWWSFVESTEQESYDISCHPKPGPFVPCEDIFQSWTLRLGVWMVFILALLGNTTVLLVNIFSKTKMDVSRFLICNLACADFMMGLYLAILAVVDISTLGEFRRFGVEWQRGRVCKFIGFLGVLSSELSIYTLSVITLERFYTLKYALYSKRLKLKGAVIIMAFGWLFAIIMATLPLCGISQYITVVCLPVYVEDKTSLILVMFVLILNALSFVVLMCCYASIYYSIQGSSAWNSQDSLIAKRMSILVFTDFICWAPILFFAITSAFDMKLISLYGAKFLTIFILPVNSCANPFLYTLLTKQFKADCRAIVRKVCGAVCPRKHARPSIAIGNLPHGNQNFDKVMPLNGNGYLQRFSNIPISDGEGGNADFEDGSPKYPPPPPYDATENRAMVSELEGHGNYLDALAGLDLDHIRRGSGSPLLERHEGSCQPPQFSSGRMKPKRKKFMIPFLSWRGDHRFNKAYSNKDWDGSSLRNSKQLVRRSLSMTEGMLPAKQVGSLDTTQDPKADSSTTPELLSSEGKVAAVDLSLSQYLPTGQGQRSSVGQSQTPQRSPEHRSNRSPVHLWIPRSPLSKKPKGAAEGKDLTTNSENTTEFSLTEFEQEMDSSQNTDLDHLHPAESEDAAEPTASLLQESNSVNLRQESSPKHSNKQGGEESGSGALGASNLSSILESLQAAGDGSESSDKLLEQTEAASSPKRPKESLV